MEILINEDYKIDSDAHSFRVCKRKTTKQGDVWTPQSWHGTPGHALKSLGTRMLRESDAKGIAEALAEMDRITDTLSRALTGKLSLNVVG